MLCSRDAQAALVQEILVGSRSYSEDEVKWRKGEMCVVLVTHERPEHDILIEWCTPTYTDQIFSRPIFTSFTDKKSRKCHNFPASFATFFAMATSKIPNLRSGFMSNWILSPLRTIVRRLIGQYRSKGSGEISSQQFLLTKPSQSYKKVMAYFRMPYW